MNIPQAPILKHYDGEVNFTESEKEQIRAFIKSAEPSIVIGERTFMVVHRNCSTCREWHYNSDPMTHYSLAHSSYQ